MQVRALIGNLQQPPLLSQSLNPIKQVSDQQQEARFTQFDNEHLSKSLNRAIFQQSNDLSASSNAYMNIQIESSASKTHYSIIGTSDGFKQGGDLSGRDFKNQMHTNQHSQNIQNNVYSHSGFQNSKQRLENVQKHNNMHRTTYDAAENHKHMFNDLFTDQNQSNELLNKNKQHMYQTSYESRQQDNNEQRCKFIQDSQSIDSKIAGKQVYSSNYRVNMSKKAYQKNHSLYLTKGETEGKNKLKPIPRQPNHFMNTLKQNSQNLNNETSMERYQNDQVSIDLRDSIKISRIAQNKDLRASSLGQYKGVDKSVNNRSHINSDFNYTNKNPSLKQIINAETSQGMNQIQFAQEDNTKQVELSMSEEEMIQVINLNEQNNADSNNSAGNHGQSELQSPHSAQDNINYMLKPKGLIVMAESSNRTNQNMSNRNPLQQLVNHNQPDEYLISNLKSQQKAYYEAIAEINQQSQKAENIKSDPSIHNTNDQLVNSQQVLENQQLKSHQVIENQLQSQEQYLNSKQVNLSINNSAVKHSSKRGRRRSQQSSIDLSNILDVVPLVTDHINQKSYQEGKQSYQKKLSRTVAARNRQKQSVELSRQDIKNLNSDFLQVIVEHKIQPNVTEFLLKPEQQYQNTNQLTVIQSNDHINSSNSNLMSSVNNQLLVPAPQNMKSQNQASISHTPPDWDAVYQHNSSSIGIEPKTSIKITSQNISQNNQTNRSQKYLAQKIEQGKSSGRHAAQNKLISSEKKIYERVHANSGLDKIEAKTLKLDQLQSQDSNNYQRVSAINFLEDNKIYSDQSKSQKNIHLLSYHQNQILKSQINSNVMNSGDQRELIFSVQKSFKQGSQQEINQASMKELCVGTDEFENLMNEDQLSSHMSSILNMQGLNNQNNNGQIYIQKGGANIQDMFTRQIDLSQDLQHQINASFVNNTNDYGQTDASKALNSTRIVIENNSRVIVKNVMGKNKVLYVQGNGKSIDVDAVKEIKQDKLKVFGDSIQPRITNKMNSTNSVFQSLMMDPVFVATKEFKDADTSLRKPQASSFLDSAKQTNLDNSLRKNLSNNNDDLSQFIQEFDNTAKMESIRTYNPNEVEHITSGKQNPFSQNAQSRLQQDLKMQEAPQNISTPMTEMMRYSQGNRNQSQISQVTRNLVPTVLITSNTFKNAKQIYDNSLETSGQKVLNDDSLITYDHPPNFTNYQLKSVPRLVTRTKTSQGHRVVLFTQKNFNKDEKDIQTLRAYSNELDSPQIRGINQYTNQLNTLNNQVQMSNSIYSVKQEQRNFQSSPVSKPSPKKGLFYKISQQFTEAAQKMNKLDSITREQNSKIKTNVQLKSYEHNTLREISIQHHSRANMTQDSFYQKNQTKPNQSKLLPYQLMNIQDDSLDTFQRSRNLDDINYNHTDQSIDLIDKLENQRMRSTTAGTVNDFMISSKNQSHIHALEKKIFRRERVLNNADRSMIEMKGYPFLIPNQSKTVQSDPYEDQNSRQFIRSQQEFHQFQEHHKAGSSRHLIPKLQNASISQEINKSYYYNQGSQRTNSRHNQQHYQQNSLTLPLANYKQNRRTNHLSMIQKGSTVTSHHNNQYSQSNAKINPSTFNQYNISNQPQVHSSMQKKARRNLTQIIQQQKQKSDGIILI
eukprot:403377461